MEHADLGQVGICRDLDLLVRALLIACAKELELDCIGEVVNFFLVFLGLSGGHGVSDLFRRLGLRAGVVDGHRGCRRIVESGGAACSTVVAGCGGDLPIAFFDVLLVGLADGKGNWRGIGGLRGRGRLRRRLGGSCGRLWMVGAGHGGEIDWRASLGDLREECVEYHGGGGPHLERGASD